MARFDGVQTQVLGLSVDSIPSLKAWAESLGGITYPLLSDFYPHGLTARTYGVLRSEGYTERAIFIIDKTGVIRYVDVHDINTQPDNEELFKVLTQLEGVSVSGSPAAEKPAIAGLPVAAEVQAVPANAAVVMYCTPWCPECGKARIFFNQYGISFVEVNISRDRQAASRLRSWTGGFETTPTFDIHGQVIVNFQKDKLAELLGIEL